MDIERTSNGGYLPGWETRRPEVMDFLSGVAADLYRKIARAERIGDSDAELAIVLRFAWDLDEAGYEFIRRMLKLEEM